MVKILSGFLALALLSSACGAAAALIDSSLGSLGSNSSSSSSRSSSSSSLAIGAGGSSSSLANNPNRTGTCNKMNLTGAAGGGGENSGSDTAVGAAIAIVASVISNVGVNVQKAAHVRNERAPKEDRLPFTKVRLLASTDSIALSRSSTPSRRLLTPLLLVSA